MIGPWFSVASVEKEPKLHLLNSANGINWELLCGGPVYSPPEGELLDPSIAWINNCYFLAHSLGAGPQRSFALAVSVDLFTWGQHVEVDCSIVPDITLVRSPRFFLDGDGSVHILVMCSSGGKDDNFKIYETHPISEHLTRWSPLLEVTGHDFPEAMGDPFLVKVGEIYHLWYCNFKTKQVEYAVSDRLLERYYVVRSGDWASWGAPNRNYSVVEYAPGKWRAFMKTARGVMCTDSEDGWKSWTLRRLITTPVDVSRLDVGLVCNLDVLRDLNHL
jgi:hypothetical protein